MPTRAVKVPRAPDAPVDAEPLGISIPRLRTGVMRGICANPEEPLGPIEIHHSDKGLRDLSRRLDAGSDDRAEDA